MPIDPSFVGRRYGPFVYEAGLEKMREFAFAISGGVPSTGFSSQGIPEGLHPLTWDERAGRDSPWGSVVAMPTFAVNFAIAPFAQAILDPALALDVLRLVHGDQRFEFFAPVRVGDRLTTTGSITSVETRRSLDFLEVTTETVNQRDERVVRGVWTAIIRG